MATYRSFEELEGKTLKLKDEVIFEVPTKFKLPYLVGYDRLNSKSASIIPAQIFIELGLDKIHEAALAYGYPSLMSSYPKQWPVTRLSDYPALTRLVLALFKKCEEFNAAQNTSKEPMKEKSVKSNSLYKVGDKVVVKDQYDSEYGMFDYPCVFTSEMLKQYGGKKVTIAEVKPTIFNYKYRKFYKEDYQYKIKEDSGAWNWCAGMFKGKVGEVTSVEEEPYEVGDFVKITSVYDPTNCPLGLTKAMVDIYGGQWCRIKAISSTEVNRCWMSLESTDGILIPYTWTKEMFSEHRKVLIESPYKGDILVDVSESSGFSFTIDDIPKSCPYHPYVIDQAVEQYTQLYKASPTNAFKHIVNNGISTWFTWSNTAQGQNYWKHIFENENFIPRNYTPKYYKKTLLKKDISFDSDSKEKTIKKAKKKSIPESSFIIPLSYEEVKLSLKKPTCKF